MKLTTMKFSVPVLMLMMFQSGYGTSDWIYNAFGMAFNGHTLAAVEYANEQAGSVEMYKGSDATELDKVFAEIVESPTTTPNLITFVNTQITNFTPSGLTDKTTTTAEAFDQSVYTALTALDGSAGKEITVANVQSTLTGQISTTFWTDKSWWQENSTITTAMYGDTSTSTSGWIDAVTDAWDAEESTETSKKTAIKANTIIADLSDDEVTSIYNFVKEATITEEYTAGYAAEDGLINVLVERVIAQKESTEESADVNTAVKNFLKIYWYRDATSETDNVPTDAVKNIVSNIKTNSSDAVKNASTLVVGQNIASFLRHDALTDVDTLKDLISKADTYIEDSTQSAAKAAVEGLIQTFDDVTADNVTVSLKHIKKASV